MRAAIVTGGRLEVGERPDPVPRPGEILIRVRAAGINGADLMQRAGRYPPPAGAPADVPGLECAGEVEATGERVMALLPGGGQAELATVDERHVLPVPDGVDWPAAGGFMEVFATAHDALFSQAELRAGERLLVNGAAGGVGTAAVQLGIAAGAEVTGTARRHADRVRALGAGSEPDGEYDVILELVGGDNLAVDLERLALRGRLAVIGTGAGSRAELDFGLLMRKRGRIHGSTLRSRSGEEKALVVDRLAHDVLPLLAAGRVSVAVHESFPLERAQEAYDAFAAGGKFGKLVLVP
ncbi:MAG TPA: zinc-binding dehydrogenase [Gaiellaceae bacterium]|nr:zinc-binding dehydrogenase [Gaiellaceae bacterium]